MAPCTGIRCLMSCLRTCTIITLRRSRFHRITATFLLILGREPLHEVAFVGSGRGPLPPHMLHELATGLFGPKEREALEQLFANQHTADRLYEALYHAPPEFALLAALLLRCHISAGKC